MNKLDLGNNEFINYEFHENSGKPTIVFSNSLGSDLNMWSPQVEFFKNDYQLALYDKRGHGKSSPVQGPYTFDMLENDVVSIMDELNIAKAHFVGLSMGGMTSLGLALKHSDRFNKMVCCAARADMPPPAIERCVRHSEAKFMMADFPYTPRRLITFPREPDCTS